MKKLEQCIKYNTSKLSTATNYDIKFECGMLYGLPAYEVIEQGYGDISKPYISDDYKKLKYLEKPLLHLGLTPSTDSKNGPGKNQFIIYPSGDMIAKEYGHGHIEIRLSNSDIPSNLDRK